MSDRCTYPGCTRRGRRVVFLLSSLNFTRKVEIPNCRRCGPHEPKDVPAFAAPIWRDLAGRFQFLAGERPILERTKVLYLDENGQSPEARLAQLKNAR